LAGARKALALHRLDAKQQNLLPLDVENPPSDMFSILDFFEHMSLLVDRGYLAKEDVWTDLSEDMFPFYADARPIIEHAQKQSPASWGGFTDLMEDMRKLEEEENKGTSDHPSVSDILDSYQGWASSEPGPRTPRERAKRRR
jgi:hypothetical protein